MNDSETAARKEAENLKQQCLCLQRQITTLLVALIVVSGTLSVFLWRQVRYARRDLEAMKPSAMQIIQEFNQVRPGMEAFVTKITEYGRTHPDFAPIMRKYQIPMSGATTQAQPTAKPATSAPAPKK